MSSAKPTSTGSAAKLPRIADSKSLGSRLSNQRDGATAFEGILSPCTPIDHHRAKQCVQPSVRHRAKFLDPHRERRRTVEDKVRDRKIFPSGSQKPINYLKPPIEIRLSRPRCNNTQWKYLYRAMILRAIRWTSAERARMPASVRFFRKTLSATHIGGIGQLNRNATGLQ